MKNTIMFFINLQLKSRRFFWLIIIGCIPVGLTVLALMATPVLENNDILFSRLFPMFNFFLYLHLMLPVLAILTGVAVTRDWIDDQTLPYLLVRPLPLWKLILSKLIAYSILPGMVIIGSLLITYSIFKLQGGLEIWWYDLGEYFVSSGVLVLGLLTYVSVMTLFSLWLKHAALIGLFFAFGWENFVASLPIKLRYFTIVHYLHSLYPTFFKNEMKGLLGAIIKMKFTLTGDGYAILILLCITAIFGGLMLFIFHRKEFRLERT